MLPELTYQLEVIENTEQFISELGLLHDAVVEKLEWSFVSGEVVIEVDDLYSNFFQTFEYPYQNETPARFIASQLLSFEIDVVMPRNIPARILKFKVNHIDKQRIYRN
jgi:hypothetical protein